MDDMGRAIYAEAGKRIREYRIKRQLTQEQLSEMVGLGRTSVTNIELGRQYFGLDVLLAMARSLDCPLVELLPSAADTATPSSSDRQNFDGIPERTAAVAARLLRTGA